MYVLAFNHFAFICMIIPVGIPIHIVLHLLLLSYILLGWLNRIKLGW